MGWNLHFLGPRSLYCQKRVAWSHVAHVFKRIQDVNCDASSVACKVLCRPGCVADDPSGRFQTRPHSGEECPAARISAPNTHRSMSRNSRKPRVATAEGSFTSTVCCNILGLWKLYFLGFPEGTRFQQFMVCDKTAFTDIQIKSIALMALFLVPSCFNMFGSECGCEWTNFTRLLSFFAVRKRQSWTCWRNGLETTPSTQPWAKHRPKPIQSLPSSQRPAQRCPKLLPVSHPWYSFVKAWRLRHLEKICKNSRFA